MIFSAIRKKFVYEVVPRTDSRTVIDNGDAGFEETGSDWQQGAGTWFEDYRLHRAGEGTDTAEWQFNDLEPGSYELYVTWPADTGIRRLENVK